MNDSGTTDRRLTDAFRAIAADEGQLGASPAVESRVMAAFEDVVARRRRTRRIVGALAAAAVIVAMAAGALKVRPLNSGERPSLQTSDFKLQTSAEVATAFLPLAYSGVPTTDGHVVRMEVPRASLVRFGLLPADMAVGADAADDAARGGTVIADVVIGDDGLARAVRFVRKVNRKEPRR